jgi:hypothetical protein
MQIDLIDLAVNQAIASSGMKRNYIAARSNIPQIMKKETDKVERYGRWSLEEDNFLRKNLGVLSEEQIARKLGRTKTAVHLRWKRDLLLPAPSKHPNILTANQAADMLNIEIHAFCWWCDHGLIPARVLPGERRIRAIDRLDFKLWVINPQNWIYFDWKRIADPNLRRLCELRSQRWNDEWWTARQVADYHGVDVRNVSMMIKRGELHGVQTHVSRGGRHEKRAWAFWYVRKSDAIQAKFFTGKGSAGWQPGERATQWMLKARKLGWGWTAIGRSMKSKMTSTAIKNHMVKRFGEGV